MVLERMEPFVSLEQILEGFRLLFVIDTERLIGTSTVLLRKQLRPYNKGKNFNINNKNILHKNKKKYKVEYDNRVELMFFI